MRSDLPDAFEIDPAPIWPVDDDRLEPAFLDLSELPSSDAAQTAEFDELGAPPSLELDRYDAAPDEPLPPARDRAAASGLLGSLGVHALVLLALFGAHSAPAEVAGAIPVRLVIEQPPAVKDESQPAQSPESASEPPPAEHAAAEAAPPRARPRPQVAAARPRPKPEPQPPAKPAFAATAPPAVARPPAAPAADAASPAVEAASLPKPGSNSPAPGAGVPGPNTSRGDYLDYLVTLTRGHFDLLPLSFLAGRHGRTILSVLVYEDGTISRVSVKQTSGYPDIDARIEQMVTAVGRFPPVPDTFRKPSVELDFNLAFPDALQQ